nr:histone deacetylase 14 [Tanacetum cinerariifolium]
THNINQRLASPFHLAEEDHRLGNLKFFPKGEEDEVLGMQIPKELITDNIRNASYYNAYMKMAHGQALVDGVAFRKPAALGITQKLPIVEEEKTVEVDEGQAGSDRGKPPGSRPQPERVLTKEDQARPNPGQSHVALVGPNLEPMHEDFVATVYNSDFNNNPSTSTTSTTTKLFRS